MCKEHLLNEQNLMHAGKYKWRLQTILNVISNLFLLQMTKETWSQRIPSFRTVSQGVHQSAVKPQGFSRSLDAESKASSPLSHITPGFCIFNEYPIIKSNEIRKQQFLYLQRILFLKMFKTSMTQNAKIIKTNWEQDGENILISGQ